MWNWRELTAQAAQGTPVTSWDDIERAAHTIFATLDDDQEHFIVLLCGFAEELIGYQVLASGSSMGVEVDMKLLFRTALLFGAPCILAMHNHPSGWLEPSGDDQELTRRMVVAGQTHEIPLVDHLIWSPQGLISLRQQCPQLFAPGC